MTHKDDRVIKTLINFDKHDEELTPWTITKTDDYIDFLFEIYHQANKGDKKIIKEDIKTLLIIEDTYIFTSTDTNEFISSDDEETFNNICKDFIYYYWKNDNN